MDRIIFTNNKLFAEHIYQKVKIDNKSVLVVLFYDALILLLNELLSKEDIRIEELELYGRFSQYDKEYYLSLYPDGALAVTPAYDTKYRVYCYCESEIVYLDGGVSSRIVPVIYAEEEYELYNNDYEIANNCKKCHNHIEECCYYHGNPNDCKLGNDGGD